MQGPEDFTPDDALFAAAESTPAIYSVSPTGEEREGATYQDAMAKIEEFSKESEVKSPALLPIETNAAQAVPNVTGEKVLVHRTGGTGPELFVAESTRGKLEDKRDQRVFDTVCKKLAGSGISFNDEQRQILFDLLSVHETEAVTRGEALAKNPDALATGIARTGFVGEMMAYLNQNLDDLKPGEDPRQFIRQRLAGEIGERLNLMFSLKDERVTTVVGGEVIQGLPDLATVPAREILSSKALFAQLLLAIEEDTRDLTGKDVPAGEPEKDARALSIFPDEVRDGWRAMGFKSLFRDGVRNADYKGIQEALVFNQETGKYEPNNEVLNPQHPAVVEIFEMINGRFTWPDFLLVEPVAQKFRLKESKYDAGARVGDFAAVVEAHVISSRSKVYGAGEVKFWKPSEAHDAVLMTDDNEKSGELGGVRSDGMKLTLPVAAEQAVIAEMIPERNQALPEGPIFLARFPQGTRMADIKELGYLAKERGQNNVVIQMIPFSRAQEDVLVEALLEEAAKTKGFKKLLSSTEGMA